MEFSNIFKKNAIVDFLTKLPVITHRAFLEEHLKEGFLLNGQMDSISRMLPDIYKIAGTLRGGYDLLPEVEGMIRKDNRPAFDKAQLELHTHHFQELFDSYYDLMSINGHIDETEFDKNGVERDRDSQGNEVEKHQGLMQENRQRAKIISHEKQRQKRKEMWQERRDAIKQEEMNAYTDEQKHFKLNAECEEMLKQQLSILIGTDNYVPKLADLKEKKQCFGDMKKDGIYPSIIHIKEFCKVRLDRIVQNNGKPKYATVKGKRGDLIDKAISLLDVKPMEPFFQVPP